jgi:hypothetical protein
LVGFGEGRGFPAAEGVRPTMERRSDLWEEGAIHRRKEQVSHISKERFMRGKSGSLTLGRNELLMRTNDTLMERRNRSLIRGRSHLWNEEPEEKKEMRRPTVRRRQNEV